MKFSNQDFFCKRDKNLQFLMLFFIRKNSISYFFKPSFNASKNAMNLWCHGSISFPLQKKRISLLLAKLPRTLKLSPFLEHETFPQNKALGLFPDRQIVNGAGALIYPR